MPVFFILTNTKTQAGYEKRFSNEKEILGFGKKFVLKFETITTDNEDALNNGLLKNFPQVQRISCYYHYKQTLERNAKKWDWVKKNK